MEVLELKENGTLDYKRIQVPHPVSLESPVI